MAAHLSSCGEALDETQAYWLVEQGENGALVPDWLPSTQNLIHNKITLLMYIKQDPFSAAASPTGSRRYSGTYIPL